MKHLREVARDEGAIPLSFVATSAKGEYANLGDALSPIMVSLVTSLPTRHVAQNSTGPRLGAVGTIGHGFSGGDVWIWGTGSSKYRNAGAPAAERELFRYDGRTNFHVSATRGPVSWKILTDGKSSLTPVYGDPVWLLPQFYPAKVKKRYKLGVIIHLADLADRAYEAHPKPEYIRYNVADAEASDVVLINTVTEVTTEALRERLDLILSCERLVSTSLHGMVFAESYGIPCLYFAPRGRNVGLSEADLIDDGSLDLRIIDLYQGLGKSKIPVYVQDRRKLTNWEDVTKAIDSSWSPVTLDTDALIDRLPLDVKFVQAKDGDVFEHRLIKTTPMRNGEGGRSSGMQRVRSAIQRLFTRS